MALEIVDARSERPAFRFDGTPSYVHGGGPGWPRADQATARRFAERLEAEGGAVFAGLTCR